MVKVLLISKAEFARRAGVTAAVITRHIKTGLDVAMVGKRINVAHPAAIEFLKSRTEIPVDELAPAAGIDSLYNDAVNICNEKNRFTITTVRNGLKIGTARAKRIFEMMQLAGTDKPIAPVTVKPVEHVVKGYAARNKKNKDKSLDEIENGTTIHEVPENIEAFADMTLRELIQRFGTDTAFVDWLKATKSIEDINEKRLKNAVSRGELVSRDLMKIGVIDPINAAHIKLLTDGAKTIALRVVSMHDAGRPLKDCEKFVSDQITSFIKPVKSRVARALKNA